jgi:hypothetical protein
LVPNGQRYRRPHRTLECHARTRNLLVATLFYRFDSCDHQHVINASRSKEWRYHTLCTLRSGLRPSISFPRVYSLLIHPVKAKQAKPVASPSNPSPPSNHLANQVALRIPNEHFAATFQPRIITHNRHTLALK